MAKKDDIDEDTSSRAVNDAWTGMLIISFLCLTTGAGYLAWDYFQYPDDPPKQVKYPPTPGVVVPVVPNKIPKEDPPKQEEKKADEEKKMDEKKMEEKKVDEEKKDVKDEDKKKDDEKEKDKEKKDASLRNPVPHGQLAGLRMVPEGRLPPFAATNLSIVLRTSEDRKKETYHKKERL